MVDAAEVRVWGTMVGAVRWDEGRLLGYFQYHPGFLEKGWELSPLKMPLSGGSRIYSFPELRPGLGEAYHTFKGLPGMLADALPDKFGNKLINLWLARQGRTEQSMNPVERLCFTGTRAMGALEFQPAQLPAASGSSELVMDTLVQMAGKMLRDREAFTTSLNPNEEKAMMDVLKIGTSAGGARPKAVIAFHPTTGEVRSGQGKVPAGFSHWLIKLDGVGGEQFGESQGWGRVEYAYYLMAKDCGITISESRLLEENGRAHFMTKRFDRERNTRHHVQTLCGLQHYDFNDMYGYSYEQVFETMRLLRLSYPEAEQMFRRMVFNVLATNYDDHTKNFAFILKKDQPWALAPAYDLCFAFDPGNHWVNKQTLSVNGKRLGIAEDDLMRIAKDNNIKKGKAIIDEINAVIKNWSAYANSAGVRQELRERIGQNLNTY